MKLRKYQEEAVEAVLTAWKKFRRVLIVLPTGCGKTVVFASVVKRLLAETHHCSHRYATPAAVDMSPRCSHHARSTGAGEDTPGPGDSYAQGDGECWYNIRQGRECNYERD